MSEPPQAMSTSRLTNSYRHACIWHSATPSSVGNWVWAALQMTRYCIRMHKTTKRRDLWQLRSSLRWRARKCQLRIPKSIPSSDMISVFRTSDFARPNLSHHSLSFSQITNLLFNTSWSGLEQVYEHYATDFHASKKLRVNSSVSHMSHQLSINDLFSVNGLDVLITGAGTGLGE